MKHISSERIKLIIPSRGRAFRIKEWTFCDKETDFRFREYPYHGVMSVHRAFMKQVLV